MGAKATPNIGARKHGISVRKGAKMELLRKLREGIMLTGKSGHGFAQGNSH
jgi:hypothetical protein